MSLCLCRLSIYPFVPMNNADYNKYYGLGLLCNPITLSQPITWSNEGMNERTQ